MKHIRKFNESTESKSFKNSNDDIKDFFIDYIDENPNALNIEDGYVYNGEFIDQNKYMRNSAYAKDSKYRNAKLISLKVDQPDGIEFEDYRCMTNFDKLSSIIEDIERFYGLSNEEINFIITTEEDGLIIKFITLGNEIEEESKASKIDNYLKRIGEWVKERGYKKQTIQGNWLDIRFPKGGGMLGYAYSMSNTLRKAGNGELNKDNAPNDKYLKLIDIRNEAWEDGLKFDISGGDQQVVVKMVKR